jgi:hypothetical protein
MMIGRTCLGWVAGTAQLFAAAAVSGQELRFTGALADGTLISAQPLHSWHEPNAQPRLENAPLFDPQRPMRWLRADWADAVAVPRAGVELIGGDRLPGRVVGFGDGTGSHVDRWPAHLVVRPEYSVDRPGLPPRETVRVAVGALRRVIWQRRRVDDYQPRTVFLLDGSQVTFERLRWSSGAVTLLQAEGPRRIAWGEIAEVHLADRNPWEAYVDSLAVLCPGLTGRLMQVETTWGLVATTSLERFQPQSTSGQPHDWFHVVQPAWSLDPLWLRHPQIVWRRFFAPHEVPLSLIEPRRATHRAALSGGRRWQLHRSALGQPLRNAGRAYGWGFGVQAHSELEFPLSPLIQSFRCRFGLDEGAGRGGCARGAVYLGPATGTPLAQTKVLVGSGEAVELAVAPWPAAAQPGAGLVLVADMADPQRPAGADPLDIRDLVDWLEPIVELDVERLRAAVAARAPAQLAAWQGWELNVPQGSRSTFASRWDSRLPEDTRFRPEIAAQGGPIAIRRRIKLLPDHQFLVLSVDRQPQSSPSRLELRIDGRPTAELNVPERHTGARPTPWLVPLRAFHGREATLEVAHFPGGDNSFLDWRGVALSASDSSTPWTPLDPQSAVSAGGATLSREADGAVFATGPHPEHDTYTLTYHAALPRITGFRLEALTDSRIAGGGPGREGPAGGNFVLTDIQITAAPLARPGDAQPVPLAAAAADFSQDQYPVQAAIDADPKSGWAIHPQINQPHLAVFTAAENVEVAGGVQLVVTLAQRGFNQASLGRLRFSVTGAPRPLAAERPGALLPVHLAGKPLVVFEDQGEFVAQLNQGSGTASLESADKFSGNASLRVTPDQKFSPQLPGLGVRIRREPGPGEYRFLRFAWKKPDGQSVCLQLHHDGAWGPNAAGAKFRYHAGPGPECFGGSLQVSPELPTQWTVVTRDLAGDFGEFTLQGLAFSPIDGQWALFDQVQLGRTLDDFAEGAR